MPAPDMFEFGRCPRCGGDTITTFDPDHPSVSRTRHIHPPCQPKDEQL